MNIIISILILMVSTIFSVYLLINKKLNIIASIDSKKIPDHLKNKVIMYFVITLMISTFLISLSLLFIEKNFLIGITLIIISILICLPFYSYCSKIYR